MRDETLPINHSSGSHVLTTTGGAAGGAIRGGLKGLATSIGATLVVGGLVGLAVAAVIPGALTLTGALIGIAVGSIATTAVSSPLMTLFTGIGGLFGGFKGAGHAHQQVRQDRAAAHMVDAELGAMQAQAMMAQAQSQRPGDRYANASTMLQTEGSQLDAASIQRDGLVSGQQLQRA